MDRLTYTNKSNGISVPRKLVYDINMDRTNFAHLEEIVKKLAYYEDLEESGRLKILPCKEGEIVYKEIIQHDSYDDSEYKIISAVCFRLDMLNDMNKTIFLTREEAEEKLKEIE